MSMTSDPVSIFFKHPTFVNLLEATLSLFTRTFFAVFGLVIKTLRVSLILTIFVAIHAIAVIDALLMLIVAFALVLCALAAVCPPLANIIDKYE